MYVTLEAQVAHATGYLTGIVQQLGRKLHRVGKPEGKIHSVNTLVYYVLGRLAVSLEPHHQIYTPLQIYGTTDWQYLNFRAGK